ncbi:class I SAM-dependent methyltransferase [candidate division WOR-3 bacterium]|nr:class I SAM-dependent methyltransferase [candidate division WOR-3 bacterium]
MKNSEIPEDEVARCWDKNANVWAEYVRKGWDAYREYLNNPAFLRFIGDINGKKVLDAGCGEGYNTRILARNGAQVIGVDISKRMIELAQQEEQREPLGIRYEITSFSDLSIFNDSYFDVVVSFMALMDTPDYEGATRELYRIIREKGELFFSITHPCFLTKGIGWIKDAQGNEIKLTVSDYFEQKSYIEHWRFSKAPIQVDVEPFAVPCFPRTFSEYLNVLVDAGFVLKRLEEPRPTLKMCKKHPWLQRWRDHAAIFLYVYAEKP